jgi:hypothetical protein
VLEFGAYNAAIEDILSILPKNSYIVGAEEHYKRLESIKQSNSINELYDEILSHNNLTINTTNARLYNLIITYDALITSTDLCGALKKIRTILLKNGTCVSLFPKGLRVHLSMKDNCFEYTKEYIEAQLMLADFTKVTIKESFFNSKSYWVVIAS